MIELGNKVFYARVIPQCDIFEVLRLTVRTADDDGWCVGVDNDGTKQAFPFDKNDVGTLIFFNEKEAEAAVKDAKKKYGTRKLTKIKEGEEEEYE